MTDIIVAIVVMSVLSLAMGLLTAFFAYSEKGQRSMLFLAYSVLASVYFLMYQWGQLHWARWIPVSAAIIYSNLTAVFAAMASGWAWRLMNMPRWRRATLSILLAITSIVTIHWPLLSIALRPAPEGGDVWVLGVAKQTSWATCSPAAAATLFRAEGIKVSEAEMIPLCLTDESGTPTLGLYRGIKLVAERNDRSVSIVNSSLDQLMADNDWPVLLAVRLPYGVEDRRYEEQWGWIPGMGHSVVALGRTDQGYFLIGDPSVGLERWTREEMEILWQGSGIRISN